MRRSSSCARRRLLARAAFTLAALHAAPAAAQARFELPDLTVHLERYTTIDDCLAAVARVRDSVESHAAVWRDSMPQGPEEMHEPLAAPVVDRWGAVPIFWVAALVLPALALYFAVSLRNRRV